MKKVFIKYNPYMIRTEITIDGERPKENSRLWEKILGPSSKGADSKELRAQESRLQEWVEYLPEILTGECNDKDLNIEFHGTLLDYEDLNEVFTKALREKTVNKLTIKHIPAKEISDKEAKIDTVFEKIRKGPFDELKDEEVVNAFQNAKNSDFEVCVVAVMSAGKSTLINSMLQTKLMPSKQEACTAIITRIKDKDGTDWSAEVYNNENKIIETYKELNYNTMNRLNADERVSTIKISGDIPFVTSEDISLVLIDTPGPNNARDPEHGEIQKAFLDQSSKALVLYVMEGTFGNKDDNTLLKEVANSMSVGGKQSKDRFIFVVNKMDGRRKDDGDIQATFDRVRLYLRQHGIENPNLFPAAALPALDIRLMKKAMEEKAEVDEEFKDEAEREIRKLNRNEELHLETYAPLPASIKKMIEDELEEAKRSGDYNTQALIHTGIVSVEAAIRQYVQKYAKTAKIKNVVDTFLHKLEQKQTYEDTKKKLLQNQKESKNIVEKIDKMNENISNINTTLDFEDKVQETLKKVEEESGEVAEEIGVEFQSKLTEKIGELKAQKDLKKSVDEAKIIALELKDFAGKQEILFKNKLGKMITNNIKKTKDELINQYKDKLISIKNSGISIKDSIIEDIQISPLQLISDQLDNISIEKLLKEEKIEDRREWVKNYDKKWYKPWTWFQESGHYETIYKTVVNIEEMVDGFFVSIEKGIRENVKGACDYASEKSKEILGAFSNKFKKLDDMLKNMFNELKSYATDKENVEERIRESEEKIRWIEEVKKEVESILDI